MSIKEAKDQAARGINIPLVTTFEEVKNLYYYGRIGGDSFESILNRAMEIYAEMVGKEQWNAAIDAAADSAEVDFEDYDKPFVNKQSILKLKK